MTARGLMFSWMVCHWLLLAAVAAQPSATSSNTAVATSANSPEKKAPKFPPLRDSFLIKNGFRLETVASDPLVSDPHAMAFDENGRLFVIERRDYPSGQRNGRIRLLEESDGDGVYDTSTVYADNLDDPTALICYDGGLIVACGSRILYLKDTKGDGVSDLQKVVLTGTPGPTNAAVVFTSFAWGLDNYIHVGTAGTGGDTISGEPGVSLVLSAGNFAFDPRGARMVAESGVAPTGLCFDDRGRKYVCSTGDHLVLVMYEARYAERQPFVELPSPLLDVSAEGPGMPIYLVRIQPGVQGGHSWTAGHFSTARGLMIYRGNIFPNGYVGNAFVADPAAGLVHHDQVRANGVEVIAQRPADEIGSEFLSSRDGTFQPVQAANGPDGALYVADQARRCIFRIVPLNFKQPKPPRLGHNSTAELTAVLRHPNGWYRDTAARLLYERQDIAAVAPLARLLYDPWSTPLSRMHGLHALEGLHRLTETVLLKGLTDSDERVREHALLLSENMVAEDGAVSDVLWDQLNGMTEDPSLAVRYQLAFTLGQINRPGRAQALLAVLHQSPASVWMQTAVLSSSAGAEAELFGLMADDPAISDTDGGRNVMLQLAFAVGNRNHPGDASNLLTQIAGLADPRLAVEVVRALGEGLDRTNATLSDPTGILSPLYGPAMQYMQDTTADETLRTDGIYVLGCSTYGLAGMPMILELDPSQSDTIQTALVDGLARLNDPRVAPSLVQRWPYLKGQARSKTMEVLMTDHDRTSVLLSGVENGIISPHDLSASQVQSLLFHHDSDIRQRAGNLFGNSHQ